MSPRHRLPSKLTVDLAGLAGYTQLRLTREMVADQRCRRSGSDRSLGCHALVEPWSVTLRGW